LKVEWDIARSRVARRIGTLFLFGTLVPLIAVAALSYFQVRAELIERGYGNLAQLAAAYASSLNERMLAANDQLRAIAGTGPRASLGKAESERLGSKFNAVQFELQGRRFVQLLGDHRDQAALTEAELAFLGSGKSLLRSVPAAGGPSTITLITAVDPSRPTAGTVAAELNPSYVWGDGEDLPALTDFSVANEKGDLLHSSLDQPDEALRAMRVNNPGAANGRVKFDHLGVIRIAQFRELFLEPHFFVHGWTVFATKPEEDLLVPLARFRDIFVPTLGLTLFGIALLSLTQVRRTLVPLERLIDGTRRVANKDFATPVVVDTADEFGELAASFNAMSSRLGSQFTVLSTLADIDRAILSRPDVSHVIETILLRIHLMIPACDACIAVLDRHDSEALCTYTRSAGRGVPINLERWPCSPGQATELGANPRGEWLEPGVPPPSFVRPLLDLGADALFMLPIVWHRAVVALMVLGFRDRDAFGDEAQSSARALADRVGVVFAATAREEQLYYQAHYDSLTGLPNRLYFKDQLGIALAQAHRGQRQFALVYIDLDNFKSVNDGLGHAAGDNVLREAAVRLRRCVREADAVARLGGDEFTIILREVASPRDAQVVAEHVIAAMSKPFSADGHELFLNASIGIALYPNDGATPEELLRNADTAMYRAKESGRGRSAFFEEEMNVAALARVSTERDLRHAIERREFVLHYQPIIDSATGRAVGVEALVRWNHSERGLLAPAHFVDLAEQIGLVDAMGDWVLEEACARFCEWRRKGLDLGYIAVNVSARQFRQPDFVDKVARTLQDAGIEPAKLEVEITESLLLEATAPIEEMIAALRELGVQIALDDFGTGYSSLAYLRRFPVNVVKIDRSFVKDLPDDSSSAAIVRAIVSMAHALDKQVVAEGVATAEQAAFLKRAGCDRLQGFHHSEPLAPAQLEVFLREAQAQSRPKRIYAA
jgi:diguanylate cyclase (GGDEF)-like protein